MIIALWVMVIYTVLAFWITWRGCGPDLCVAATGCRGRVGRVSGRAPSRAPMLRFMAGSQASTRRY